MTSGRALSYSFDADRDVATIAGVQYAGELFRGLGFFDPGTKIEILRREDGCLTVRTIYAHELIREISAVNLTRCNRWHPDGVGSWSLSDWFSALAGETGEMMMAATDLATAVCSMGDTVKKLNRARDGLPGNKLSEQELRAALRKEIADVYLYLDLLADRADIDLAEAVRDKFNEVSDRNGFPERL